jgi:hypothetical protein
VWISLTKEISRAYIDEDGNMQCMDYLLEEVTPTTLESFTEKKNDIPQRHNTGQVTYFLIYFVCNQKY